MKHNFRYARRFFPVITFAFAAAVCLAQPAFAGFVNGGFTLDIIEGDVTYQSAGGGTVLSASDMGVSYVMPTDLAQEIVNGETVPGAGFTPGMNLSPYAAANMTKLTGVTDTYFINNAMAGEPGAFLDHNGNVTTYDPLLDSTLLSLISGDLTGLLPGYSVASSSLVMVDNEQYFADYADLGGNAPVINVNYLTYTIVETAPDGGATASLLGFALLGLFICQRRGMFSTCRIAG